MLWRFVVYGMLGWCVEIVWTALQRFHKGGPERWRLQGHTYLWMFPIYGLLVVLYEPLHNALRATPWPLRALAYAIGFMLVEYVSGWILRRATGRCPWDYTGASRWQVHGLVRLDYAPAWAVFGLALEPLHDLLIKLT